MMKIFAAVFFSLVCLASLFSQSPVLLKDINPAAGFSSNPSNFTSIGKRVFFSLFQDNYRSMLWSSDGTAGQTNPIDQIHQISPKYYSQIVYFDSAAYFFRQIQTTSEFFRLNSDDLSRERLDSFSVGIYASYNGASSSICVFNNKTGQTH